MKNPSTQYKKLRRVTQKAISGYEMINPGDRIIVGLSGGPDSFTLLHMLNEYKKYIFNEFEISALNVDLGFKGNTENLKKISIFCKERDITFHTVKTDIKKLALAPDAKKNPCFICSLNRRKEIYNFAFKNSFSKIAYGHHQDDIIETLLINILFGRKIDTMYPVQEVFSGDIKIIRPFSLAPEHLVKSAAKEINTPQTKKLCPVDGDTRREKIKDIINKLQKSEPYANIKRNIFRALLNNTLNFPEFRSDFDM